MATITVFPPSLYIGEPIIGGVTSEILFNNTGVLAGSLNLTYNNGTNTLTVPSISSNSVISGNTINANNVQVGSGITLDGPDGSFTTDFGSIFSDGGGDLTVNILTIETQFSSDSGQIFSDGSGNLVANQFQTNAGTFNVDNSGNVFISGVWQFNGGGSNTLIFADDASEWIIASWGIGITGNNMHPVWIGDNTGGSSPTTIGASFLVGINAPASGGTDWGNGYFYAARGAAIGYSTPQSIPAGGLILTGQIGIYNNISGVGGGCPYQVATIDLVTQGGAISATTLYSVPSSAGLYRVSFVASITRIATTSAILGGTNGFQIKYTDANDSVVKTSPALTIFTSSVNSTATTISGSLIANAKANTNIQYLFDFTSVGVQNMQYNLHIRVEAL